MLLSTSKIIKTFVPYLGIAESMDPENRCELLLLLQ